jgi:large subunit ribosomal protein L17
LILTEENFDDLPDDLKPKNLPKTKGRIITTIQKAKEVRPLVERCVTIACRALPKLEEARRLEPDAERNSDGWRQWRQGEGWQEWSRSMAPVVTARRQVLRLLGRKQAVRVLFEEVAPRFVDRAGGYTRVLRLSKPRLGDCGTRAILEFVGTHDRKRRKAQKPAFETETPESQPTAEPAPASETAGQGS